MPARLTICPPGDPARIVLLGESEQALLGREPEARVRVNHPSISRRHALIRHDREGWWLEDESSKNGSFLHGERIRQSRLADGDWFQIGDVYVEFETLDEREAEDARQHHRQRFTDTLRIQRDLTPSAGVQALIERTLDGVLELARLERGFLLLRNDQDWTVHSRRGLDPEQFHQSEFSGSATAVEQCLQSAEPVVINEIGPEDWLGGQASVLAGGIRALVCLPLSVDRELLGATYADSRQPVRPLAELDLEILQSLATHAAMAIEMARMREELQRVSDQMDPAPGRAMTQPTWAQLTSGHAE